MLRRRDAGESDRRLSLLTQERGVIDVVAKGARKGGSRLAGSSEPLSVCIFQLASGKHTAYITQSQPIMSFPGLRGDYEKLTMGIALTELASAILPHEHEADDEFRFLVTALRFLEIAEKPLPALIWAELKLMELAGFQPDWMRCVATGEPIGEAMAWVSPHAGGYVSPEAAARFTDRFQVRAEALYGASRMAELESPPPNLKFADEILRMLFRFWLNFAEDPLKANRALVESRAPESGPKFV